MNARGLRPRVRVALAVGALLSLLPRSAEGDGRLFVGVGPAWSHSARSEETAAGFGLSADFGPPTPLAYTARADYSAFRESAGGGVLLTLGFKLRRVDGLARPYLEAGFGVVGFGESIGVGPAFGGGVHLALPRGPGWFAHVHWGHGAAIESDGGSVVLIRVGVASR